MVTFVAGPGRRPDSGRNPRGSRVSVWVPRSGVVAVPTVDCGKHAPLLPFDQLPSNPCQEFASRGPTTKGEAAGASSSDRVDGGGRLSCLVEAEAVVERAHGELGVLRRDEARDFDFARRYRLDVDRFTREDVEHPSRDA